jgi:sugar lactone lactonase YvrE
LDGLNIGRITTAGVFTQPLGTTGGSGPNAITAGPDGALWFTWYGFNEIGRITTAGAATFYPIPTADSDPDGITAGPDGALWFTEGQGGKIGRITTAGAITEYPLPTAGSEPTAITAGPGGALWFLQTAYGETVGRITTAGAITSYKAPGSSSWPTAITAGPDGELWFTDSESNRISEVFFLGATLSVTPAGGAYEDGLSFTGSGFAPNETVQIYQGGIGSAILAGGTADASGSFTAAAQVPQSAYGPRLFVAMGQTSGELGAANFSILPRLILQPASGPAGSTVIARGTGFLPLEKVWIYWADPSTLLGTTTANVDGTFDAGATVTFTVPSGISPGVNKVLAGGNLVIVKASAPFTVQ